MAIIFLIWSAQVFADSATLAFETQTLDLDTGTTTEQSIDLLDGIEGEDVRIAYNADRIPHAVLTTIDEGVTLAFINGVAYDSVTSANVAGLSFSSEVVDQPLQESDTVVVKTDSGAIFKLGNAVESDAGVTFSYELLQ